MFKVREEKLNALRKWFEILSNERRAEAIDTFEYENISREVFVLFQGYDGNNYVIGLNEVTGQQRNGDPAIPINQEHKKILEECLEPVSMNGNVLLDLSK